ncbi:MAG: sigma-70 family RNA polymerase sigma factor, partial [Gammaproteobacteria bacterium]
LPDPDADPLAAVEHEDWEHYSQARLYQALASLDERSRDILENRWLAEEKLTLQALADKYGVSAERIRQLEKAALQKLRRALQEDAALLA